LRHLRSDIVCRFIFVVHQMNVDEDRAAFAQALLGPGEESFGQQFGCDAPAAEGIEHNGVECAACGEKEIQPIGNAAFDVIGRKK
jgi:hypothetical protein